MGITDRQGEWLCRGYSTLSLINSSAINDFDFCSGYLFDVYWRGSDLLSFVIQICFNAGGHLFWITCSRWVLFAGITFAWVRRIYEMKFVPGMSSGKAAFAGRKRGFIIVGPRKRYTPPPSTTEYCLSASRLKFVLTAKLDAQKSQLPKPGYICPSIYGDYSVSFSPCTLINLGQA